MRKMFETIPISSFIYHLSSFLLLASFSSAGVPSPMFVFYGEARDTYGWPYQNGAAVVVARAGTNEVARYTVRDGLIAGVNFGLFIHLQDVRSNVTYWSQAVSPGQPVTISVLANNVEQPLVEGVRTFIVGHAGSFSNVNMTVGTDVDGDGLPDAWEQEILYVNSDPRYQSIWDIKPNDDYDGDGASNVDEFRAGTFAFLSTDYLFAEEFRRAAGDRTSLQFLSVPGKAYGVDQSAALNRAAWSAASYGFTASDALRTGQFAGTGDWMTLYPLSTNRFNVFRIHVRP